MGQPPGQLGLAVSLRGEYVFGAESRMSAETAANWDSIREQKDALRKQAHANRNAQEDKDELSRRIVGAFMSLPEYATAQTVMFYIDVRSEVRTRHDLQLALESGKTIVVPWCNAAGELELFRLSSMEELELGMYRILEPKQELRGLPEKQVDVAELDLIMVPGVAFDRRGGRMGHGKGYYDKLLQHARPDTPLVALAFECQLFEEIPVAGHDIFMDRIITELQVYQGRGRA
jgi:5-formyltetrahydrofolate cyclo-ligase